jgi:hypothetical protein
MKETCEALGVSRQMVQKLEAAGELKATRESGRVFFGSAEVEALHTAREVAKVEREQEAEEREFQGENAEADRHDVEFAAWSKTFGYQQEQRKLNEALGALTKELRELRDAKNDDSATRDSAVFSSAGP